MTDVIILLLDNSVIWLNAQSLTETEYANTKMQLKAISGHVQMIFDVKILTIMRQNEAKKCSEGFGIRSFHLEYEAKGSLINDNHTGVICNDKAFRNHSANNLALKQIDVSHFMTYANLLLCYDEWKSISWQFVGIALESQWNRYSNGCLCIV